MRTYEHNGRWLTEVRVDAQTTFSRPATDTEIAKANPAAPVDRGAMIEAKAPEPMVEPEPIATDATETELEAPKRRGRPPKVRE